MHCFQRLGEDRQELQENTKAYFYKYEYRKGLSHTESFYVCNVVRVSEITFKDDPQTSGVL